MNNCQPNCGCKFEVDSSCVRYTAVNLGTTLINVGDTIETTIIKIDQAITNLQQTIINNSTNGSPLQISGPIDRVVKFGPSSNPLLPSQTIDDGTSIGINATPDSSSKVLIETSANQSGLKVSSLNNGKEAITASSQAVGAIINKGIISFVSGSTTSNIGIETSTTGSANINVGISASAFGATNNYSAQLRDGSETTTGGKFLKDTGSGKANWNYIYLSDIQDYQAPSQYSLPIATNTVLGGIKVGDGLSITNQGVLSANIGQGTLNYIAKFTPDGYSVGNSKIYDNGTIIGIGNTGTLDNFVSITNAIENITLSSVNTKTTSTNWGGFFSAKGIGASNNFGIETNASGAATNYATSSVATGGTTSIGTYSKASGATNNYSVQLQDGTQAIGKFLKSITNDGHANWMYLVTDITHAQLVTLLGNNELTPGTYYRITDYQTIYEQPDFIEYKIPVTTPIIKTEAVQPIIVLALKSNKLSEDAFQEDFPKDTIKYRLIYNTKITGTPTKGRIYERIDEYGNRTDFDHRNVLFKRYFTNQVSDFLDCKFHFPITDNCSSEEVLTFDDLPSGRFKNVYIEGNWGQTGLGIDYFDLPNIVFATNSSTPFAANSKIGVCSDVTINHIEDSTIGRIQSSSLQGRVIYSKIGTIIESLIIIDISLSNIDEIRSLYTLNNEGQPGIEKSNIKSIKYTSHNTSPTTLYPFAMVNLGNISSSEIEEMYNVYPRVNRHYLINGRDGSKLYSGSSIFTPGYYSNITIKRGNDIVVVEDVEVYINSNGLISTIQYTDSDRGGISVLLDPIYYLETTTTNEVGKLPSNIAEKVEYNPKTARNGGSSNQHIIIENSKVDSMVNMTCNGILMSKISEISSSNIGFISYCEGNRMRHLEVKSIIDFGNLHNIIFQDMDYVVFSEMANNYFTDVYSVSFGLNFGLTRHTSSDPWIDVNPTSVDSYKTTMPVGNVFNSLITNSSFGDYVHGNIFETPVISVSFPDYFTNNTIKALPVSSFNQNFLKKYRVLTELPIKCEIDSYFVSPSDLGMSTTLGSVINYSGFASNAHIRAKLFRVEQNYIGTSPRLWYVFEYSRFAPDITPYSQSNFAKLLTDDPRVFQPINKLLGTSTLVGDSKLNMKKLREYQSISGAFIYNDVLESTIKYPTAGSHDYASMPDLSHLSIPTKEDLELIHSLGLISSSTTFWSSSEANATQAWAFDFSTGQSIIHDKSDAYQLLYIIDTTGSNKIRLKYSTLSSTEIIDIDDQTE